MAKFSTNKIPVPRTSLHDDFPNSKSSRIVALSYTGRRGHVVCILCWQEESIVFLEGPAVECNPRAGAHSIVLVGRRGGQALKQLPGQQKTT